MIRFPDHERHPADYRQIQLPMYDAETEAKQALLANALSEGDIVILASQRLYGSIGKLRARYPFTNRYYGKLFNGELGYEPVLTVRNEPGLPGMTIRDDPFAGLGLDTAAVNALPEQGGEWRWNWGFADESVTVYDHPQPIVFQKMLPLTEQEILARLKE
jgi:hypothetical protein